MNQHPLIFHGEWWVPDTADLSPETTTVYYGLRAISSGGKHIGTLTYYENQDSTLGLYYTPSILYSRHDGYNDVMWGRDANGHIFTLFNVVIQDRPSGDITNTVFDVGLILYGEHVLNIEDARFSKCIVQFPYLRNWAFHDNITGSNAGSMKYFKAPLERTKLLETLHEDGTWWRLWQRHTTDKGVYDLTIQQTTEFEIEALKPQSIQTYLKQVKEFTQFLSIALYCEQNPTKIVMENCENKRTSVLLFKKYASANPGESSLIKFGLLKDKLPSMLNVWHENYDKISPISSYLIDSLDKKNQFDVPDFLIIAQALDGYHKRFVNKKEQKDIRKYDEQIKILLNQFKDVEAIKKCKINPTVLKDTRHKYSHLYPDDEKSLAVEGDDLYSLTETCKILLTCCILNMLGLTNKEINLCCNLSPISQIIDTLPFEID